MSTSICCRPHYTASRCAPRCERTPSSRLRTVWLTSDPLASDQRWGEFLVSRLSPIGWSNESFSHLVIPDSYRRIVKALVTVQAGALKDRLMIDVVEGKGNGLVMAFHGPPGTGKVRPILSEPRCLRVLTEMRTDRP